MNVGDKIAQVIFQKLSFWFGRGFWIQWWNRKRSAWLWLIKFLNGCIIFWCFLHRYVGWQKNSKKCVNKFIPDHVDQNIKWHEFDGLFTYIDELKCKNFFRNPDAHFKAAQIANFDIIYHECRSDLLENFVKTYETI